ncbi:MAG: cytochrome c [Chloroflexi bacterium]|nr:cytochrome c [Chloroflexota bacterium]
MSKSVLRNVFIFGSLFFLIVFLALSYDSLSRVSARTPAVTAAVEEGKRVWQGYDCMDCHTILGNGAYLGPDLTKVVAQKGSNYVGAFLKNPQETKPGALMPNLHLSDKEVRDLVAFLTWVGGVDTNNWPPKPAAAPAASTEQKGREVFQQKGCSSCHAIAGVGGHVGPDLTKVGDRLSADYLRRFLKDPAAVKPGTKMPKLEYTPDELDALVSYLASLK